MGLCCYLYIQVRAANAEKSPAKTYLNDIITKARLESLEKGDMDIRGLMSEVVKKTAPSAAAEESADGYQTLTGQKVDPQLKKLLKFFFSKYDADNNNSIDAAEFGFVLKDLGLDPTKMQEHLPTNDKPLLLDDFCVRVETICRSEKSFNTATIE